MSRRQRKELAQRREMVTTAVQLASVSGISPDQALAMPNAAVVPCRHRLVLRRLRSAWWRWGGGTMVAGGVAVVLWLAR